MALGLSSRLALAIRASTASGLPQRPRLLLSEFPSGHKTAPNSCKGATSLTEVRCCDFGPFSGPQSNISPFPSNHC